MINFYRKIRQNLVVNNQGSKYFKYAIGEIFLVVLGILIALQINNWNEKNKTRERELIYLNNIKEDLRLNINSLKEFIVARQTIVSSSDALLQYFEGKPIRELEEFNYHNFQVMVWFPFIQNTNTYSELMNSGNFAIIRKKSIKNEIQDMQTSYQTIAFIENEMQQDYERYLYEVFFNVVDLNTSFKNFEDYIAGKKDSDFKIDRSEVDLLLKSKLYKNGLVLASYNSEILIEKYSEMIERTNQLIKSINEEERI